MSEGNGGHELGIINQVGATTPDIAGVQAGNVDRVDTNRGVLILRGFEAGPGIQLDVVRANNDVFEGIEHKIVISNTHSGADTFLQLTDAPHSYAGHASQFVKVNPTATGLIFSAASGSGNTTYVVPNIPSRNALVTNIGDTAFVQDTGAGEWGYYIWGGLGLVWTLLVNQDASTVDAHTISVTVNWNTLSPALIGTVSPHTRVVLVSIEIGTPWTDPAATMSIGDAGDNGDGGNPQRLVSTSQIDLTVLNGTYELEPVYQYVGPALEIPIYVYFNSGTSVTGQARVTISYV